MSLVLSIAREEPLCIKASADASAAWGRNEKGYGFCDRGSIDYAAGQSLEITLNIAVRPNGKFAEFANFPVDLETSGDLTDDGAPVGVYAVKQGKATVAIMVPFLQDELDTNVDQPIDLDRVLLVTGADAHVRMSVSVKVCAAAAVAVDDVPGEPAPLVQAKIPVMVHGTSRVPASADGGARPSEPFAEQTVTAIVFAHGAVVRLAEIVVAGQILIVRHGDSNEEAACRVVTVKTNAGVKSFVELEFLRPAPGFWGAVLPFANGAKSTDDAETETHSVAENLKADTIANPAAPVPATLPSGLIPEITKSGPAATARHVFSKLLEAPSAIAGTFFRERPKADDSESDPAPVTPVVDETASVVGEQATTAPKSSQGTADQVPTATGRAPLGTKSSRFAADDDPIRSAIARAAAIAGSAAAAETQVAAEGAVNAEHMAEVTAESAQVAADPARKAAQVNPAPVPDEKSNIAASQASADAASGAEVSATTDIAFAWSKENGPKRSRAGAIAAATAVVLVAAGGIGLYRWQQVTKPDANQVAATRLGSGTSQPTADSDPAPTNGANAQLSTRTAAAARAGASAGDAAATNKAKNAGGVQPGANKGSAAAKSRAATPPDASADIVRGPEVAEMRMSSPTATTRSSSQAATPAMTSEMPGGAVGGSDGGIASDSESSGPAAPPPTRMSSGATQPRLLSAPAPIYPYSARAEHVQGDVSVDLLISDAGQVASITVISGPALLREAAVDALVRRKYAPAMLDGKPISAHIAVTIHFQL
ncbi:MAG: energy transducer TonB [Candidatus Acidiferrales bacterium]